MDKIKVISFDLDDTLWDNREVIKKAEKGFFEYLQANCLKFKEKFSLEKLASLQKELIENKPELKYRPSKKRVELAKMALIRLGYEKSSQLLADSAFAFFYQLRHQINYFPETLPTLKKLTKQYQIFALTNGNADVKKLSIKDYFSYYLASEHIGIPKSNPDFYHYVLTQKKLEAKQILHIGNDPFDDVLSANQAGISAIWFNNSYTVWPKKLKKPQYEIQSLTQLENLLRSISF